MTLARCLTLRVVRRRTRRLVRKNWPALIAGLNAIFNGALAQQRYNDALASGDPERIAEAARHLKDGRKAA